jgi:hypothetical protein
LDVAGEALLLDLVVEAGDVVAALAPALMEIRLVWVEVRGPVSGLDQQFLQALGAGETADGGVVQPQFPPDRGQRLPLSEALLDGLVAFGGAGHQPPGAAQDIERAIGRGEVRLRLR